MAYTVDKAFRILKDLKMTSNEESVRRWLRQGVIKGISPISRKEGWRFPKEALDAFIKERLPESYTMNVATNNNTTNVSKEKGIEEQTREKMWLELAKKNIFEGSIEIKKTRVHDCIEHLGFSNDLEETVWDACQKNKRGYSKPRVPYLLEAFGFDNKRLLLDTKYEDLEEQVIFAIIEYVRKQLVERH